MARRRGNRPWKEELKDLFAMHRGERRAFTVLIGLCLIAAAWVTWEQWIRPPLLAESEANALQVVWASMADSTGTLDGRPAKGWEDVRLFKFDPNGLPVEQWVLLGLSERQAGAIHRYEARGGRFRTKADLARMHVVDPELYAQWEPYIQLPDRVERGRRAKDGEYPTRRDSTAWKSGRNGEGPSRKSWTVELNTADSAALVTVNGIGPAFARSIIRYRARLGGFISLEQLAEVPILRDKPDALEQIRPKLELDPAAVVLLPINTCTVDELGRHPYMNWKVAKALIAYRQQHGPFRTVDDISDCVLVTDSLKERMRPYLSVD